MRLRSKQIVVGMISLVLLASLFLSGCSQADPKSKEQTDQEQTKTATFKPLDTKSSKVVATYQEGGKVTEGQLNEYLNILAFLDYQVSMMLSDPQMKSQLKEFKKIILKGYAAELLIAKEVKREAEFKKQAAKEMKTLEDSLKNPMMQMEKNSTPPKNLDEAIKGKGFNKTQLEAFIVRSLQRNDYFNQQLKGLKYDKVKANHVLVAFNLDETGTKKRSDADAKKRADEVKKKLDAGGDWKALVKQYSDDPGSKETAGLIEGSADQFVPEFAKSVRTLPLNKVSDPVKTEYGYHVIKVTARTQEDVSKATEEVKQQKSQQLNQDYIDKKLKIKITL
jgi:foldase protein PrsA